MGTQEEKSPAMRVREDAALAVEAEGRQHPGEEHCYAIATRVVRCTPLPAEPPVAGLDLGAIGALWKRGKALVDAGKVDDDECKIITAHIIVRVPAMLAALRAAQPDRAALLRAAVEALDAANLDVSAKRLRENPTQDEVRHVLRMVLRGISGFSPPHAWLGAERALAALLLATEAP